MDYARLFVDLPTAYLVMDRDLVIIAANDAYLRLLHRTREDLLHRPVFDAFPPEPESLNADGRNPLQLSFERVRDTGATDRMPLLQYSVRDPNSGTVEQRYWSLIHSAVLGEDGLPMLVLQRVEDVTDYASEQETERRRGLRWRRRAEEVEADLYARGQELKVAVHAQETASRRLQGLAEAALQLAAVATVDELVGQVVATGLAALGADDGAIAVRGEDQAQLGLTFTGSLGRHTRQEHTSVPSHNRLPAAWAASTGETVLLPDRPAGLRWSSAMSEVYETTGRQAWAALPLRVGDRPLGSLTVSWGSAHTFDAAEVRLLEAFAAQCAQALARLQVRAAEQEAALAAHQMSEALQRSMLTDPPQNDHLEIAVRYLAAAEQAQVGGDWYDAFHNRDGATCLVVGDVTGHDREAAAGMGQVRNLLRGLTHTLGEPPALVLSALDLAMQGLQIGALATAVLALVAQTDAQRGTEERTLRWSNAGHLPPVLLQPDGTVELLTTTPDLLLGLTPTTDRHDHELELRPGATVVLFTDGLVERRGAGIDEGLAWLVEAVAGLAHLGPDAVCEALLAAVSDTAEDDVALLVIRTNPSDVPWPDHTPTATA